MYLCASRLHGTTQNWCICQLESNRKGTGLLARLAEPFQAYPSVAEAQLLIERRCPAAWIPDAVTGLIIFLVACCSLSLAEAVWSARRPSLTAAEMCGATVIIMKPAKLLYSATSSAVGFAALLVTTQTITLLLLHQFRSPEAVVWSMIGAACLLGVGGILLFYTLLCRIQLIQSCLCRQVCVDKAPASKDYTAILAGGVLAYASVVGICALHRAETMAEGIQLTATVAASIIGPVMNLGKALRNSLETETAALQIKMDVEEFQEAMQAAGVTTTETQKQVSKFQGWSTLTWSELVSSCRSGGDPTDPRRSSDATIGQTRGELNILQDIGWLRGVVLKLTGSYAGFFVLPSCLFALALVLAGAAIQAATYSCSRGELMMLDVAGAGTALKFAPSQDHYVLDVDISHQQVFVMAAPTALARNVSFESTTEHEKENSTDSFMTVKLSGQKVPRVASVSVQGPRPGQSPRTYSVRFAPKRRLPQLLLISDPEGNFTRCIAWGALTGSQVSIPPNKGSKLNVSILFADFVVGLPYSQQSSPPLDEGPDATWTVFSNETKRSCRLQCTDDPDCLEAFEGIEGCYFAYNHHASQEARCSEFFQEVSKKEDAGVEKVYGLELSGCISKNKSASGSGSSQCSSGLEVSQRRTNFGTITPNWQGNLEATLSAKAGSLLPSDIVSIELRRDRPLPMDVLLHLSAYKDESTPFQISASGTITDTGDIVVDISKYDPTAFSFVQLILAPILPDRAFTVQWDKLPQGAGAVEEEKLRSLEFERCKSSPLLQQRYAACNDEGAGWKSKPISMRISKWFNNFNANFMAAASDQREAHFWGSTRTHRLRVQFRDVDSPAAWAAKDYGCAILNLDEEKGERGRELREESEFAISKSADAMCDLMEACMESHYAQMCSILRSAFGNAPHLGHGIPSSRLLKLLSCYRHAGIRCTEWEAAGQPWTYDPVKKQFENQMLSTWERAVVPLSQETLFSSASSIAGSDPEPPFWDSFQHVVQSICSETAGISPTVWNMWLQETVRKGNTKLLRLLKDCLRKRRPKGADLERAAKLAWEGVQASAGMPRFNASEWLVEVTDMVPHAGLARALVETAVEEGHVLQYSRPLSTFLRLVGSTIDEIKVNLDSPLRAYDLTGILWQMPSLRELSVAGWKCGPGRNDPGPGFAAGIANMSDLELAEFPGMSFSPTSFHHLIDAFRKRDLQRHVPIKKMYFHGRGAEPFDAELFGEFAQICIEHLEVARLATTETIFFEVVKAFNSSNTSSWKCLKKLRIEDVRNFGPESQRRCRDALAKSVERATGRGATVQNLAWARGPGVTIQLD